MFSISFVVHYCTNGGERYNWGGFSEPSFFFSNPHQQRVKTFKYFIANKQHKKKVIFNA